MPHLNCKMKTITPLVFLMAICFNLKTFAQASLLGDFNQGLLDKYIQAAKNNYIPKKIIDKRAEGVKTNIPITELSYLDIFNASYIYRPNSSTAIVAPGLTTANPYAVNGLQFGLTLSLGTFVERPFLIKKAKIDYEVAKMDAQEYNNTLEVEVKNRYYTYLQQVALYKFSSQNLQDISLTAEGIKAKFEKTEVALEVYDQSRISLTSARTAQLNAEVNLLKAKDLLEEIIGKKLSEIK